MKGALDAGDVASDGGVRVDAAGSADATRADYGVQFIGPGKGAWWASKGRDVRSEDDKSLVVGARSGWLECQ